MSVANASAKSLESCVLDRLAYQIRQCHFCCDHSLHLSYCWQHRRSSNIIVGCEVKCRSEEEWKAPPLSLVQRQEQELGLAFPWRPHQHPSPAALRDSPDSRLSQLPSLDHAARALSARRADHISEPPCRAASPTALEPDRGCASFRRKDSASRLPPPAAGETASSHPDAPFGGRLGTMGQHRTAGGAPRSVWRSAQSFAARPRSSNRAGRRRRRSMNNWNDKQLAARLFESCVCCFVGARGRRPTLTGEPRLADRDGPVHAQRSSRRICPRGFCKHRVRAD